MKTVSMCPICVYVYNKMRFCACITLILLTNVCTVESFLGCVYNCISMCVNLYKSDDTMMMMMMKNYCLIVYVYCMFYMYILLRHFVVCFLFNRILVVLLYAESFFVYLYTDFVVCIFICKNKTHS